MIDFEMSLLSNFIGTKAQLIYPYTSRLNKQNFNNVWASLIQELNFYHKNFKLIQKQISKEGYCCVFQPVFGCCVHPKAGQTTFFSLFQLKKEDMNTHQQKGE